MAASWMRSRRLARAWRAIRSASSRLLAVALVPAGLEELSLRFGQLPGPSLADVEGDLEAGAAVQRPRVAAELDPAGRRLAQLSEHHDRFAVLVDPVPQAGPLAQQRFVGELDGRHPGLGMAIEGEQSRLGPPVDGGVDGRVGDEAGQLGAGGAPPGRLALGADDDEPLEHLPDRSALAVVERGVEQLGP